MISTSPTKFAYLPPFRPLPATATASSIIANPAAHVTWVWAAPRPRAQPAQHLPLQRAGIEEQQRVHHVLVVQQPHVGRVDVRPRVDVRHVVGDVLREPGPGHPTRRGGGVDPSRMRPPPGDNALTAGRGWGGGQLLLGSQDSFKPLILENFL